MNLDNVENLVHGENGKKWCTKNNHWILVTEFNKNSKSSDGLSVWCRSCHRDYYKERQESYSTSNILMTSKTCPTCGIDKLVEEYYKSATGKDGFSRQCKSCLRDRKKLYYRKHPDKLKNGKYYYNNDPKYKKNQLDSERDRRINDPIYLINSLDRSSRWSKENKDRKNDSTREYRARKNNAFVESIDSKVVYERDSKLCGICGQNVLPEDFSLDHVKPLSKGGEHSYANVQTSHLKCNVRKSNKYEVPSGS